MAKLLRKTPFHYVGKVHDLTVANSHSYNIEGKGVHNSACGSLVCYVLEITDVDPIKYDLLFERFISIDREGLPDIDSDVENREQLIDMLKTNFGNENVIPISNYNTFKLKSLIRDISRFYGLPLEEVNEALKTVDKDVVNSTKKVGDDKNLFVLTFEDSYEHSKPFKEFVDRYPHIGDSLKVLFKQNKSLGRHAGGVIVSERIAERMPLIASRGEQQTPWVEGMNYKHLEMLGWVKIDILGLETLRVIRRAVGLIVARQGAKRKRMEISLDNGKKHYLFGDQIVRTKRGEVRADELRESDEFDELPGMR